MVSYINNELRNYAADDQCKKDRRIVQKQDEIFIVVESNARSEPRTVVVFAQNTSTAFFAVSCAWRHITLADATRDELVEIESRKRVWRDFYDFTDLSYFVLKGKIVRLLRR